MHPYFHITTEQIRRLTDEQARELIARLCRAQVERAGLDPQGVLWGGNQRAPDGGVDVRIEIKPAQDIDGPLARSIAVVQVKAETFGPAKIGPEMAPKGILRPTIRVLAGDTGLYLIASTRDDPADPARQERIAAMENVLAEYGLKGRLHVDFIGARQIADWVEQFPSLVVWLRRAIGEALQGWRGYEPWAYKETDAGTEFLLGMEQRVFAPGASEGIIDLEAINALRADLTSGGAVRLLGLSGVGKTRLAQALFDQRIQTPTAALSSDSVMYTDISDSPDPTPEAMVEVLGADGRASILVVDNCGQKTHSALVERKSKAKHQLGLLTIEYDIQDDFPEGTRCYRIEGASSETLRALLRDRYLSLSNHDLDVVISSSDGNARLAFALASTSEHTGDLASLRDRELFRRLFEQKSAVGDELLRCAKAASLIYSFHGVDLSPASEIALLCKFSGTTPEAFYRNMTELSRRGLLQSRGKMRALLPHAISNRLAADALDEISLPALAKSMIVEATPRVQLSFAHRLSYLHHSAAARELAERWLSADGVFADMSFLGHQRLRLFRWLASLCPNLVLAAIERFCSNLKRESNYKHPIDGIADLLTYIAYDVERFDRSVAALLTLMPLQATDHTTGRPDSKQIRQLFQLALSGTHAPASQRAAVIERLLGNGSVDDVWLGTQLLAETLKFRGFFGQPQTRIGAQKRDYGWSPRTIEEQREWHRTFLSLAGRWATAADDRGRAIRATLGSSMAGLLADKELANDLTNLAAKLVNEHGWLEAWESVNRRLRLKSLDDDTRQRLTAISNIVAPTGLRACVLAAIKLRDYVAPEEAATNDNDTSAYELAGLTAERLGQLLAAEPALLRELLPELLSMSAVGNVFGVGLGVASATSDIPALANDITATVKANADQRTVGVAFVCGLISGWHKRNAEQTSAFLDQAIDDPVLARWLPRFQGCVPTDEHAIERLEQSIDIGLAPTVEFGQLSIGNPLRNVPAERIGAFLTKLWSYGINGPHVAVDILHMVVHSANERTEDDQNALGHVCRSLLSAQEWPGENERLEYEVESIIVFSSAKSSSFDEVKALLDRAIEIRTSDPRHHYSPYGNYLAPIIRRYPDESLTNMHSRIDPEHRYAMSDLILGESAVKEDKSEDPVVPDEALLRWTSIDTKNRVFFAVNTVHINGGTGSPILADLYRLAPNKVEFVSELADRFLVSSADHKMPQMELGIRTLESLPIGDNVQAAEAVATYVKSIRERIDRFTALTHSLDKRQAESFE